MGKEIEIVRGTTNNFSVTITDGNGGRYTPSPGDVAIFGVKKAYRDTEMVITKTVGINAEGKAFFSICPEDTRELHCDTYYYDVGVQSGEDFYNIIPATKFTITKNITYKGCVK